MALVLDESTEFYTAAVAADWSSAGTLCAWIKRASSGNATYATPFCITDTSDRNPENTIITVSPNWAFQANGVGSTTITAFTADQWIFLAMSTNNDVTEFVAYGTDGASLSSLYCPINNSAAFQRISIGRTGDSGSGTQFAGKIAYLRLFTGYLTVSDLQAEAQSATPVHASCTHSWDLISSLNSTGGSVGGVNVALHASASGTTTFDSDSPISSTSVAPLAMGAYSRMRNG